MTQESPASVLVSDGSESASNVGLDAASRRRLWLFGGPVTDQPDSNAGPPTNLFELAEAGARCLATANAVDPGPNWDTFARTEKSRATYRAIQARGMAHGVRWTLLMLGMEGISQWS